MKILSTFLTFYFTIWMMNKAVSCQNLAANKNRRSRRNLYERFEDHTFKNLHHEKSISLKFEQKLVEVTICQEIDLEMGIKETF
jgi:hypothetical protein